MFRWLQSMFARKQYRTAPPWETPPDIRTKLRCANAGIDPKTVHEPQNGKMDVTAARPALESQPPANR